MLLLLLLSVTMGLVHGQFPCGSSDEGSLPRPECSYLGTTSLGSSGWLEVKDNFFCEDVMNTEYCTRDVYIPATDDNIPACEDLSGCTVMYEESVCQETQGWSIYYVACDSPSTVCYRPCCCSRKLGIGNGITSINPCSDAVISQFQAADLCVVDYPITYLPDQHESAKPLYEYVHKDDGMYSFTELQVYNQDGITTYVYNMTSQQWFDDSWATPSIWYHYVTVHIPDNLDAAYSSHALLYVSGGTWDDSTPDPSSDHVWETGIYANRTGMVTAVINQVPFQPIIFNGTIEHRVEDQIIAWTWAHFLESAGTDPPEVLLQLPMCKAVSKAMDLTSTVAADKTGGSADLQGFMLAGDSKRGWITWLMPAADDRVEVIVPIVLTSLNLNTNMHHYWRSMGDWTFLFYDYWLEGILKWIDHPGMSSLLELIDPYSYRDVLTMPKLMVSGAVDEFFMPDDYDYFYEDLLGEKYIWLMENTGHRIQNGPMYEQFWEVLESFYIAVIKGRPRPTLTWDRDIDTTTGRGSIQVTTGEPVVAVEAWMADTPAMVTPRRDFRRLMLGPGGYPIETGITYNQYNASNLGGNIWRVEFDMPASGYRVFFLKTVFDYPEEGRSFIFTTEVQVLSSQLSQYFPFEDCTLEECQGSLV